MILSLSTTLDPGRAALHRHLERDLREALGAGEHAQEEMGEIAAALAAAWAVDFRRATVPSLMFPLLATKLLCRLGRREQAARLLHRHVPSAARAELLLRVMDRGGPPLAACALVAAGILRPVPSGLSPGGSAWGVEIDRLAGPVEPVLELQLLARLRRVLEVACDAMAVDGPRGEIRLLMAAGRGRRPGVPAGAELCRFARDVLGRAARSRGWVRAPVLHLAAPTVRTRP
jgi:hypothetical protein